MTQLLFKSLSSKYLPLELCTIFFKWYNYPFFILFGQIYNTTKGNLCILLILYLSLVQSDRHIYLDVYKMFINKSNLIRWDGDEDVGEIYFMYNTIFFVIYELNMYQILWACILIHLYNSIFLNLQLFFSELSPLNKNTMKWVFQEILTVHCIGKRKK